MFCFNSDLNKKIEPAYQGEGKKIAQDFYIPLLRISKKYDRLSGYFSVDSLVITATGIAGLINNGGSMRLVLGAHDFGPEIVEAYTISKEQGHELIENIGEKIAKNLESIEDIISTRRLEALAWMLVAKKLEIRIAIPKKAYLGSNRGIFHEKLLVFHDENGCIVSANGSTNETRSAWDSNGESITTFPSWNSGLSEYIQRHKEQFEVIWNNEHKDYFTFSIPVALEKRISQRFYRAGNPPILDILEEIEPTSNIESLKKLVILSSFVLQLGKVKGLDHLGLGPVSLYPHQTYSMNEVRRRFPCRILLADEVGLGKTLEAGAIIKRLLDMNNDMRVCILTPKNVSRQWLDEMWFRFGLNFYLLVTNPKRFITADERTERRILDDENPFDKPGCDHIIASWHYARGTRSKGQEILNASKFFDLVVIDEAHAARRRWSQEPPIPTKLKSLTDELSSTSPHIILMSATPVQLDEREALDLLEILGLGGRWTNPNNFIRYYDILKLNDSKIDTSEWNFAINLALYVSKNYVNKEELKELVKGIFQSLTWTEVYQNKLIRCLDEGNLDDGLKNMLLRNPDKLKKLLVSLNPMNWFMIRNTRENLTNIGYTFPERIIEHIDINLNSHEQSILNELDEYLFSYYGMIEKLLTENKGIIGFVRTIYHQRFVSSFAAAYMTILNRMHFLEAILRNDKENIKKMWEKIISDEDFDIEEYYESYIDEINEKLENQKDIIKKELSYLEKLKNKLEPYSSDFISYDDPKLIQVFHIINKKVNIERKKVLVFSKYTDTIDVLRKFLTNKKNIEQRRIGLYTGEGGKIYDTVKRSYVKCGKEDVRNALDNGTIEILLCSEAASEGLNLQSASVVINVDMPWNPAKVEQRIGRIDRLGQRAKNIEVINTWYPNSVEAKMYRMLFERKEIYKLVVGPAQEIVSENFRKSITNKIPTSVVDKIVKDVQKEIEEIKKKISEREKIIEGLSYKQVESVHDDKVIELVKEFITMVLDAHGLTYHITRNDVGDKEFLHIDLPETDKFKELEAWNNAGLQTGSPNTLTPSHPIVKVFAEDIVNLGLEKNIVNFSVYAVQNYEGTSDLITKGFDDTMTLDIKNGKEALDVFQKLLKLARL